MPPIKPLTICRKTKQLYCACGKNVVGILVAQEKPAKTGLAGQRHKNNDQYKHQVKFIITIKIAK